MEREEMETEDVRREKFKENTDLDPTVYGINVQGTFYIQLD